MVRVIWLNQIDRNSHVPIELFEPFFLVQFLIKLQTENGNGEESMDLDTNQVHDPSFVVADCC
jgi:hypothetical protein